MIVGKSQNGVVFVNINKVNLSVNKNIGFKNKEIAAPKQKTENSKDEFTNSVNNKKRYKKRYEKNFFYSLVIGAATIGIYVAFQCFKNKKIDNEFIQTVVETVLE